MPMFAHGSYSVKIKNNILIVDAKGPFNLETIEAYRKDLVSAVNELSGTHWNQIIVLHDMSIFTPEAAADLTEANKKKKSQGLVNSAVVLLNPVGTIVIKEQMAKIYRDAGIEYKFFTSIEEAEAWLKLPL